MQPLINNLLYTKRKLIQNDITLQGPVEIVKGTPAQYTIENYDSFSIYSVHSDVDIQIVNNTITIIVPSNYTKSSVIFTVSKDGNHSIFEIMIIPVATPSIISPENNVTITTSEFTIQSSPFSGDGTHQTSDWQIASDQDFTNIIFQSLDDASNLTSITVTLDNGDYYLRVRYRTSFGIPSSWSNVVFVTVSSQFQQFQILTADDPERAAYDNFGYSVSIYGNVAIVGAVNADPGELSNAGKAYIFRYNGTNWVQEQILTADNPERDAGDYFGFSVSIYGNVAIVGAAGADPGGVGNAGKAYIFRYNETNWVQEKILTASDKVAVTSSATLSQFMAMLQLLVHVMLTQVESEMLAKHIYSGIMEVLGFRRRS